MMIRGLLSQLISNPWPGCGVTAVQLEDGPKQASFDPFGTTM